MAPMNTKLAWSLAFATDGPDKSTIRVEHGDGRVLAPAYVDSSHRIQHQTRSANEGEPLGYIESITEAENLARLHRLGIGDQL